MSQLGLPLPLGLEEIHEKVQGRLTAARFDVIDASTQITGKDFLLKIWDTILSVPAGIAVLHEGMSASTLANIFYELGLMQAYGKETLVVKTAAASYPSDFLRTEYVEYGAGFEDNLDGFLAYMDNRRRYFLVMAEQLENNPLLAIDYIRRAFMINPAEELREQAASLLDEAGLEGRAKNSVELLAARF